MKLADLYECVEAIYRAGWNDALEGREFDPQIPQWLKTVQARGENLSTVPQNAPQGKIYEPIECGFRMECVNGHYEWGPGAIIKRNVPD